MEKYDNDPIVVANAAAMAKLQKLDIYKGKSALDILEDCGNEDRVYRLFIKEGTTVSFPKEAYIRPDEFKVNGETRYSWAIAVEVNDMGVLTNIPIYQLRSAPRDEYRSLWFHQRKLADGTNGEALPELMLNLFTASSDAKRVKSLLGKTITCIRVEKAKSKRWDRTKSDYVECEVDIPIWDIVAKSK